jgi:hypothetical protein
MAFTTVCPNCHARLTTPDTDRDKKVKCKKCDEPFVARPAAEFDDNEPARANRAIRPLASEEDEDPTPPKSGHSRRPIDEEEERLRRRRDEDHEPPLGKTGRNKPRGSSVVLTLLLVVGALVIASGAVGVYYAFIKEDKTDDLLAADGGSRGPPRLAGMGKGGGPGPATTGGQIKWVDFTGPDGSFTAKFPQQPVHFTATVQTSNGAVTNDLYQAESDQFLAVVVSTPLPEAQRGDTIPQAVIDRALDAACTAMVRQISGAREVSRKTITQGGRPGREVVIERNDGTSGTARVFLASGRVWNQLLVARRGKPDAAAQAMFFDGFQLQ